MEDGFLPMQNQLKFNLGVPLATSNITARYDRPRPIIVERAGGQREDKTPASQDNQSQHLSMNDDKMALAVRLAQRDLRLQREGRPQDHNPPVSAKSKHESRTPKFPKGATRIVHTHEAKVRAERLNEKRAGRNPLKVREQGWNSGTGRPRTPPRSHQHKPDLPATTNSPPTRDTDHYPRVSRLDDPWSEIGRLQSDMEGYLQQVQVMEQQACNDPSPNIMSRAVTRRRDGYLDSDVDPARQALRQEEHATRAARQVYFLQQQVRSLADDVRKRGSNVKHTKKSQVVTRLAAAHRGAVRALQTFVSQQLPLHDLRQGLPNNYHELAALIKQLVNISTEIQGDKESVSSQQDLIRLVDRVTELNAAWCRELDCAPVGSRDVRETQSLPVSRDIRQASAGPANRGTRRPGKENRPKGVLKKQMNRGKQTAMKKQKSRQLTPERQNILRAGLEALTREPRPDRPGVAWNISADESMLTEAGPSSLILPKPLQHKRERAQKSVNLAVPESHFSDPTLASSLKEVQHGDTEHEASRDPWRPGGSKGKSPSRNRSAERNRSHSRSRSRDRCRSQSPQTKSQAYLQALNEDPELMRELFPHGVDGQGSRSSRSNSPGPRSARPRSRSHSPGNAHYMSSPRNAQSIASRLKRLQKGSEERGMVDEREHEMSEIALRQILANRAEKQNGPNRELLADMILNDVLHDTAAELESLEGEEELEGQATQLQQQPSLETLYQRLEQMELEQLDIRRRWGTIHFEEEHSSRRKIRKDELPGKPVAMEISKTKPSSQSLREDRQREYSREAAAPIVFTNTAPVHVHRVPVDIEGTADTGSTGFSSRIQLKTRLKMSESTVRDIKSNLEKYERHLRKTSQQVQGKFDPWSLVEEIADQVLGECINEIDKELEDIGENIVHQLCKSEFSLPTTTTSRQPAHQVAFQPSQEPEQEVEYMRREQGTRDRWHEGGASVSHVSVSGPAGASVRSRTESRYDSQKPGTVVTSDRQVEDVTESRKREKSSKKGVSFDQEVSYELSYERETIFDAANLEMDTPREEMVQSVDYEEDDEADDDDDDVEEVSPIDSDDLEYSTDET